MQGIRKDLLCLQGVREGLLSMQGVRQIYSVCKALGKEVYVNAWQGSQYARTLLGARSPPTGVLT